MPENLLETSARDIATAIESQRTAHAIIANAIKTNPATPCRCSLCIKGQSARLSIARTERQPYQWKLAGLGRDTRNGHFFCYPTTIDGVAVKVDSASAADVLRVANAIEAMDVRK